MEFQLGKKGDFRYLRNESEKQLANLLIRIADAKHAHLQEGWKPDTIYFSYETWHFLSKMMAHKLTTVLAGMEVKTPTFDGMEVIVNPNQHEDFIVQSGPDGSGNRGYSDELYKRFSAVKIP